MQFAQQERVVGPHLAGKGVVLAIAEGRGFAAFQVGIHPKTNSIAGDLDPHVPARIGCAPAKHDQRIEFLETSTALEGVTIQCLQHLCQAALLEHPPGILAHSLALSLAIQNLICLSIILICHIRHSCHA